jgi:hypothetical protein
MLRPDDWESIWPELAEKNGGTTTDRAAASDDAQPPAGNVKRSDKMARMIV